MVHQRFPNNSKLQNILVIHYTTTPGGWEGGGVGKGGHSLYVEAPPERGTLVYEREGNSRVNYMEG